MAEDDAWENITADGSVRKRVLRAAREDAETPVAGKELSVHYTGRLKDAPADAAPFDDSRDRGEPLKFVLGRLEVIRGWDEAFAKMRVGERAMIEMRRAGEEGHPPRIPPNATLLFDVELLACEDKKKELYQMTNEEKITEATASKAEGLRLFAEQEWQKARRAFAEASRLCDVPGYTKNKEDYGEMPSELKAIYGSRFGQRPHAPTRDWPAAAAYASRCIKFQGAPTAKALFRRGVARSHLGLVDEAIADLREAAKLDPKNKTIRAEFTRVKALKADQSKAQKGIFTSAFDKVDLFPDKPRTASPSDKNNPYAYITFASALRKRLRDDDEPVSDGQYEDLGGTIVVRVYADACPRTARNFLALCTGERGISKVSSKALHYKGCKVHRVVEDFCIQTGDIVCNDGTSGESIYGITFKDEHFKIKHDRPGIISMANRGPNTNNSQFFVTATDAPHCDGKFVAFGLVVAGLDVIERISKLKTGADPDDDSPADFDVFITDSGLLSRDDAEARIDAANRADIPDGGAEETNGDAATEETKREAEVEQA